MLKLLPLAESVEATRATAREKDRLVLALVRAKTDAAMANADLSRHR